MLWGLYEKQEAKCLQKYLSGDLPVLELGASICVISSIIAKKIFPQKVYSVEANSSLTEIIRGNLNLNELDNFQVLNYAIANGKAVYFNPGDDNTVGTITEVSGTTTVPVSALSLSDLVAHLNIGKFNLVSDIEGSEVDFLVRDTNWVRACRWMIIELHDAMLEGNLITVTMLMERIELLGFTIVDNHGPVVVAKRI